MRHGWLHSPTAIGVLVTDFEMQKREKTETSPQEPRSAVDYDGIEIETKEISPRKRQTPLLNRAKNPGVKRCVRRQMPGGLRRAPHSLPQSPVPKAPKSIASPDGGHGHLGIRVRRKRNIQ